MGWATRVTGEKRLIHKRQNNTGGHLLMEAGVAYGCGEGKAGRGKKGYTEMVYPLGECEWCYLARK